MGERKIRVLVVDDSSMIRAILRSSLGQHPMIEVVGLAADGLEAVTQIKALRPDVVTLDVEMPNMNGLQLLERAAGKIPVGFVMVSTLTQTGARITLEALRLGAFDYVTKPQPGNRAALDEFKSELQQKVIAANAAKGRRRVITNGTPSAAPSLPPNSARGWIVGIGISCGGPQTLHRMLPAFPSDFVPILVTQHMPAEFTKSFSEHLDAACAMEVREGVEGEKIRSGVIYIAPGSHHMRLRRRGVDLVLSLDGGPKVSGHRPSADVMLASIAEACGSRCAGVIMTGMGSDGANGIQQIHHAGGWTLSQDEATSLVYGMPKAAAQTGCIDFVEPLSKLPASIAGVLAKGERAKARA